MDNIDLIEQVERKLKKLNAHLHYLKTSQKKNSKREEK